MTTDSFSNGKHPRYFTAEERRERFLASRAKALAGKPIDADDSTAWPEVNDPLTSQQRKLITDAMPARGRYSPLVWLKLLEPGTNRVVRCRGRFNYANGSWVAGFSDPSLGPLLSGSRFFGPEFDARHAKRSVEIVRTAVSI
jgi:hypothetical protein